jgi:hypothetical protein
MTKSRRTFFAFTLFLLFQEDLTEVGAVNGYMADSTVGVVGIKAAVPGGSGAMAAEAEVRDTVMGE